MGYIWQWFQLKNVVGGDRFFLSEKTDNFRIPLFIEELGWEPCHQELKLRDGESDYAFTAIAEKRNFIVWLCAITQL